MKRLQNVLVNETESDWNDLNQGVWQGTVPGPCSSTYYQTNFAAILTNTVTWYNMLMIH